MRTTTAKSRGQRAVKRVSLMVLTLMFSTMAFAQNPGEYATDANTVLLMHMNESSGTTVSDSSGNLLNGTVQSGVSFGSGRFGNATVYANQGYFAVPHDAALNLTDITIDMWIEPAVAGFALTGADPGFGLVAKRTVNTAHPYIFMINNGGGLRFNGNYGGSYHDAVTQPGIVQTTGWQHIAATRQINGTTVTVKQYRNGVKVSETTADLGTVTQNTQALWVGKDPYFATYTTQGTYQGKIDELRISNIARSPEEFNLQLPPKNVRVRGDGSAITLQWENGGGTVPLRTYFIYRGSDSTSVAFIDSTTSASYTDNTVNPGNVYFYRVSAVDVTGFESVRSRAVVSRPDGLAGQWMFTGDVLDGSGIGNHGTDINTVLGADRFTSAGAARDFNGTDAYVNVGNGVSLDLTHEFTLSVWVNPRDFNGGRILSKRAGGDGYELDVWADEVRFALNGSVYGLVNVASRLNTWFHIAATFDQSRAKVYINGTLQSDWSAAFTVGSNTNDLVIGELSNLNADYFDGLIDDIRVYNRALTQAEILPLYHEGGWELFSDINAAMAPVKDGACIWGDYDNDGDLDVLLAGRGSGDAEIAHIYRNDGSGTFTDINASLKGTIFGAAAWSDYDLDGDLDLALSGSSSTGNFTKIYRNAGSDAFVDIGATLLNVSWGGVAWGDYDNDGDPDLLITGGSVFRIFRNDGGAFSDANATLPALSIYNDCSVWGDYDNDGDLDILIEGVTSPTGGTIISRIYRNDGGGSFADINAGLAGMHTGSVAWGDYDSDGDLDILMTGTLDFGSASKIYRNEGSGVFTELSTSLPGIRLSSGTWADYDNDGDLDLCLVGYCDASYAEKSEIYRNDGSGVFVHDAAVVLPGLAYASSDWGDYDNDGDLDLLVLGSLTGDTTYVSKVYRNNGSVANTPPSVPANTDQILNGSVLTLSWDAPADAQTPQNGLTYNLRVGTTSGGSDIVSPSSDLTTGKRRLPGMGNVQQGTTANLLLPEGTYYWSVQAVDNGFAGSGFTSERAITTVIPPAAPEGLTATAQDGSVLLTWNASTLPDLQYYAIYQGGASGLLGFTTTTTDTFFVYPGLTNGSLYRFTISIIDNDFHEGYFADTAYAVPAVEQGGAIGLNGIEAFLNTEYSHLLSLQGDASIEAWFKATNNTHAHTIMRLDDGSDLGAELSLGTDGTLQGLAYFDTWWILSSAGADLRDGTWHHAALTWKIGGSLTLYLDGIAVAGQSGVPGISIDSTMLYVGRRPNGSNFFEGHIDEVRIWMREQSGEEIRAWMGRPVRANEAGLALLYHFDEPSGDVVHDASVNRLHASATGGYGWVASEAMRPFAPTLLTAVAGDGQVTLTWNRSRDGDIGWYRVYAGTASPPSQLTDSTLAWGDTSVTVSGLSNWFSYYVRVTAVDNAEQESGTSNELTFRPFVTPIHVSTLGNDGNDGHAGSPFRTIQLALNRASTGDTIKVAGGTYTQGLTTAVKVHLLGGYTEVFTGSARDNFANKTRINGSTPILLNDQFGSEIDGFVFEGSSGVTTAALRAGNGSIVSHNAFRGMSATFVPSIDISGGAIVFNNTVYGGSYGIKINSGTGTPDVRNNIIANSSYGMVTNSYSSAVRSYNGFSGNTYPYSGSYTDPGAGDLTAAAQFRDAINGDFRLYETSPFVNAGDPNDNPSAEPSPYNTRIDMGTYGGTIHSPYLPPVPPAPALVTPLDGATHVPLGVTLVWNRTSETTSYYLQVASDPGFTSIVFDTTTADSLKTVFLIELSTTYYWRVAGNVTLGTSPYSSRSFTTTDGVLCVSISGNDGNDGSPGTPLRNIQTALSRAVPSDTIKVAEGSYTEALTTSKPVILLGGFTSGFDLTSRDIVAHKTFVEGTSSTMLTDQYGSTIDGFVFRATSAVTSEALKVYNGSVVRHCIVRSVPAGGTGIDVNGGAVVTNNTVYSCSFAFELKSGAGTPLVKNNIVANNGWGFSMSAYTAAERPYNLLYANSFNYSGGDTSPGVGDISGDPKFRDVANNDFRIRETSIAIDAGDPSDPVGEEPSPYNTRIDMGTYGGTAHSPYLPPVPAAPSLMTPVSGAMRVPLTIQFVWNRTAETTSYHLQVASDPGFNSIVFDTTTTDSSKTVYLAELGTTYYWRVAGNVTLGTGPYADRSFTTTSGAVHVSTAGNDANDGSVGAPFRNIQTALTAMASGDTVKVAEGTYAEGLVTQKPGYLRGSYTSSFLETDRHLYLHTSVLQAVSSSIIYDNQGIHISGFMFQDPSNLADDLLDLRKPVTVTRNIFRNSKKTFAHGIEASAAITIINNTFYNCYYALYLNGSAAASVVKNNIFSTNNYAWYNLAADGITSYNILYNSPRAGTYTAPGIGETSLDPQFNQPASGNFMLAGTSPAMNTGDPSAAYNDPDGTRNDMGAFPFDWPPAPASGLSAIPGTHVAHLTWNANAEPDVLGYYIYGGTAPSPSTKIDSTLGGRADTTYTVSGLVSGTTYHFIVQAFDRVGNVSGLSNEVSVTPDLTPLESDSLALVDIYNSTNGANWTNRANWLTGPIDTWYGLAISGDRVTEINLDGNNLVGPIPESIGNLSAVWDLRLGHNQLSGGIPPTIGNMTALVNLIMWIAGLSGPLPAELGNLTNLSTIYLQGNQISGSIPASLGGLPNLGVIELSGNQLTGSIPPELGSITTLVNLLVGNNQLTGTLPVELTNLSQLFALDVRSNQLTGEIPQELGRLSKLKYLFLLDNQFSGAVPDSIVRLTLLEHLYLNNNRFEALPDLSPLTNLTRLGVAGNRLTMEDLEPNAAVASEILEYVPQDSVGVERDTTVLWKSNLFLSVPYSSLTTTYHWMRNGVEIGSAMGGLEIPSVDSSSMGSYSWWASSSLLPGLTLNGRPVHVGVYLTPLQRDSLALVDLYNSTNGPAWTNRANWLTGPIDTWYGLAVSGGRVTEINLDNNNLVGPIPASIGQLDAVTTLAMGWNSLNCPIPAAIGDMTALVNLHIWNSGLTGTIPSELGSLPNLVQIYLNSNQLTGTIPEALASPPNLGSLVLNNNLLTGTIPAGLGAHPNLVEVQLGWNQLTGSLPVDLMSAGNLFALDVRSNQLSGTIPQEIGRLSKLKYLFLLDNQFSGAVPDSIVRLTLLEHLYLNNNRFEALPDLSPLTNLTRLGVAGNRLTMEDLEPNAAVASEIFEYVPQDSIGVESDTVINVGQLLVLVVSDHAPSDQYQWLKDGNPISNATGSTYTIASAVASDAGAYSCEITNNVVTGLTLSQRPVHVVVNIPPSELFPFADDFESGLGLDPFWTESTVNGDVAISTDQAHSGTQSVRVSQTGTGHAVFERAFSQPIRGRSSVWFYENGAGVQSLYVHFSMADHTQSPLQNFEIATEDWDGGPYYVIVDQTKTNTGITRTNGWHFLETEVDRDSAKLWIDGTLVGEGAGDFHFTKITLGISGPVYQSIPYYFDDFTFEPAEPRAPENLTAEAGDGSVMLRWDQSSTTTVFRYNIYGGESPQPTVRVDSVMTGRADTSITLAGLVNGTTYYYRVTSVDADGNEGGYSNEISVIPAETPPMVAGISPSSGVPGTSVTLLGSGFSAVPAENIVRFGGVRATVTAATTTSLTVTVPSGASYGPVSVTVAGLSATHSRPFNVTVPSPSAVSSSSYKPKVDLTTETQPRSVVAADFDGDGRNDLAVAAFGANAVNIFRNIHSSGPLSPGSFDTRQQYATGTNPWKIASGDLDGDGRLDLVTSNHNGSSLTILRNTSSPGSITLAPPVTISTTSATQVTIADVDLDGKPDIVTTSMNSDLMSVFRNQTTGTTISFAPQVDFWSGDLALAIAAGDLTDDGRPEIVVTSNSTVNTSIFVYRNTATPGAITTGSFDAPMELGTDTSTTGVSLGDIDGDGKTDILVVNSFGGDANIQILRNNGTGGSFSVGLPYIFMPGGIGAETILLTDANGDGLPDPVTTTGNAIAVFQNTSTPGSISLSPQVTFPSGTTPYGVAAGDLNGDGLVDLVTANYNSQSVSIFENAAPTYVERPGEYAPDASTVLLLHMNDYAGSTVVEDRSGHGNNGTISTGVTIEAGRFDMGKGVTDVGQSIFVPHDASFDVGSGALTVEFWVQVRQTGTSFVTFAQKLGTSSTYKGWVLGMDAGSFTPRLSVYSGTTAGETTQLVGSRALNDGRWHHLAAVISTDAASIYVDGMLERSMALTPQGMTDNTDAFVINNPAGAWSGVYDEVRYSNRARSPQEFDLQLPPKDLTASSTSPSKADLSWSNGGGAVPFMKYYVYRGLDSMATTRMDSVTGTTYQDGMAAAGSYYYYRIAAVDSTGFEGAKSYAAGVTIMDVLTAPPAPTSLAANAVSSIGIDLSWTDNAGTEEGFRIERRQGAGSYSEIVVLGPNVTSYSDRDLLAQTQYTYKVRAYNSAGVSAYSNEATATTLAPITIPVTFNVRMNVKMRRGSFRPDLGDIVKVAGDFNGWENTADTLRDADGDSIYTGQVTVTEGVHEYKYLKTLRDGIDWEGDFLDGQFLANRSFVASRTEAVAPLVWFDDDSVYTPASSPPVYPSDLVATGVHSTGIQLSWTDLSTNENGFAIERKVEGGEYAEIVRVRFDATGFADEIDLVPSTVYFYRMRAYNAAGFSVYSNEDSAQTLAVPTLPEPPTQLTANAVSSSQIDLSWTDNATNEEGFTIERKTGTGGTYSQIGLVGANVTTYQNSGLSENTLYYYRIRAYNTAGASAYSNEANATTLIYVAPPPIPTQLTTIGMTTTTISLSWNDDSANELHFHLERKTGTEGTYSEIATLDANTTTYTNTGLTPATLYVYRIRASNAGGYSGYSNEANGTTATPDITAPASPIATQISPQGWSRNPQYTVTWTHPTDPSGISAVWYAVNVQPSIGTPGTRVPISNPVLSISLTSTGISLVYVYLEDGQGNADPATAVQLEARYDPHPPIVQHDSLAVASFNSDNPQSILISASASDGLSGMTALELQYRRSGTSWDAATSSSFSSVSGGTASIPGSYINTNRMYGVDYRVRGSDGAGNVSYTPVHSIRIIIATPITRVDPSGNTVTQPNLNALATGTPAVYAYRMFSVPLDLDDKSPRSVFETHTGLGSYNTEEWRFFSYNSSLPASDPFDEYPSILNASIITPGKAFFLIVREGVVIKAGPGSVIRAEDLSKNGIQLQNGYNFIGNPLNVPIHLDSLSLDNGQSLTGKTWEFVGVGGSNSGWNPNPSILKAWEGIVINMGATGATTLRFNIVDRSSSAAPEQIPTRTITDNAIKGENWTMRISATRTDNRVIDEENILGVSPMAADGIDSKDLTEPPFMGSGMISVAFPNESAALTHDIREGGKDGYVWDFELRTGDKRIPVDLAIGNASSAGKRVFLFDLETRMAYDVLRDQAVRVNSGDGTKAFRLVIGDLAFIEENSDGIDAVPKAVVLHQNYPNPFNPETIIRFTLPEASPVHLTVHDILGREIRTLISRTMDAGYHEEYFNAAGLSAGVYIVRLETGTVTTARKIVLLK